MFSLAFFAVLASAVKIPFSGPLVPDEGMHVVFSNVQKITVEKSSNPYSQNFKKPYFSFEFDIKGKKIKEGDFYAIIEKTDDFHISCERYKSMGTVTAKKNKLTIKGKKQIKESGFYSMYICKSIDNDKVEYTASGWVSAKSVHGFIEPGNFGEIQFEAILSMGYFFFCIGWLYLMSKWADSVMFIHKVLTVLLVSTFFNEIISWYVLDHENKTGEHGQIAILAQLFSAFHGTLVRYVGLMIAFGWGLATNQVPQKAYFQIFSMVYFVMTMVTDTKQINTHSQNYFNILSTAFSCVYDATWGSLIMKGLDDIQVSLKESSQTLKAGLYQTLKKITDIALSIAVIFCIMSFGYMESDYRFTYYSAYWWFCHSCWTFEFAVLLALACYFFRPQRGSRNMAEGVQIHAGPDSDEEHFAAADNNGNFAGPPSAEHAGEAATAVTEKILQD
jgi:hypothetical protein